MRRPERGFTLVELIIVVAIVGILASAALPLARWGMKRNKEHELQQNLRILRNAIDRYHDAAAAGLIEVPEGGSGFPPSLAALVEGVPLIAPMPTPFPAISAEYDASGPGLTGGLPAQVEAQQQASGGFIGGGAGTTAGGLIGAGGQAARSQAGGATQAGVRLLFTTTGTQPRGNGGSQGEAAPSWSRQGSRLQFGQGAPGLGPAGAPDQPPQPLTGPDGEPVLLVLLRRLPIDPLTGDDEWGLRCYGEPPDDRLWCGRDVFDVYSKSLAKAIDGTHYRDW